MTTTENQTITMEDVNAYENTIRDLMETKGIDPLHASIENDMAAIGGMDAEFQAFMQSSYLKSLFFLENWVFIVVDVVAMKISSQPLRVMTSQVVNGKTVSKPIEGHRLQSMIDYPNRFQAYSSWCYNTVVDLCMTGNSAQWYAPTSNQLIALPTDSLIMDFDKEGNLASYSIAEAQSETRQLTPMARFAAEEVVHLRRPNPGSLLWGLSPFIAGRKSVLFQRYSQDYLNAFYQKGAMPGFALKMDKDTNERVAMRIIRSFENAYTGRRNMRRTLMLPKGVDIKEMTPTLANQNLKDYINLNREDIIALLKVPKHELSLQEAGSLGSEEAKTSLKNFWHATLLPMMKIIEGELSRYFVRRGVLTPDQFLEFDVSNIDALQEDQISKATYAEKLLKTHTLNEVRQKVYDMLPIDGGDVVVGVTDMSMGYTLPPAGQIAPDAAAADGEESVANENQTITPAQALNGAQVTSLLEVVRAYRAGELDLEAAVNIIRISFALSDMDARATLGNIKPVGPTTTAPENAQQEPNAALDSGALTAEPEATLSVEPVAVPDVTTASPIRQLSKDAMTVFLKGNDDWFAKREAAIKASAGKIHSAMEKRALKLFADQAVSIISTAKGFLREKGWDDIATKAEGDNTPKTKLIKKNELRRRLLKGLEKFESKWVKDTSSILSARMDTGYEVTFQVPFNAVNPNDVAAARERGRALREDAIEERQGRVFSYLSETTVGNVFGVIERGIDEGKTIQQIAKDLRDKFSDVKQIGARAMVIARTETATALALGQAAAMRDFAEIVPDVQKMWITAQDERVRGSHEKLHGEVVDVDKEFSNGLQFPSDPEGDPDEIINCRCTWITMPKDQMDKIESGQLATTDEE